MYAPIIVESIGVTLTEKASYSVISIAIIYDSEIIIDFIVMKFCSITQLITKFLLMSSFYSHCNSLSDDRVRIIIFDVTKEECSCSCLSRIQNL